MEFRTKVDPSPLRHKIDYSMKGLSLGSCFATNIAAKLQRVKFQVESNPFGVLYNPASVADALETLGSGRKFTTDDLVREGDLWSSFSFHGSFSSTDPVKALHAMNDAVEKGGRALSESDYVILTFGTSWIYELNPEYEPEPDHDDESLLMRTKRLVRELARPRIVANCHKFPARAFNRRRLTVGEIVGLYSGLLESQLRDKHVLLTVSPVRHVKDGLVENGVSKAALLLAASELSSRYENVDYFPAYEIVNDELRDYRFYDADMVHPSQQAVDYIWELFADALFSKKTNEAVSEIEKVVAAAEHRPFNPESSSHRRFLRSMLKKTEAIARKYPRVDLSEEIGYFGS